MMPPDHCPVCGTPRRFLQGVVMYYNCGSSAMPEGDEIKMIVNICDESDVRNWVKCKKCGGLRPKSGCGACVTRRSILRHKILGVLLMEVDYESKRLTNIADKVVEAFDE